MRIDFVRCSFKSSHPGLRAAVESWPRRRGRNLSGGAGAKALGEDHPDMATTCRGTLLIRNTPLLGPYSRTIPRVLWWS